MAYDITQFLRRNPLVEDVTTAAQELDRAISAQEGLAKTAWSIPSAFAARKAIYEANQRVKTAQKSLQQAQRALQCGGGI